MDKKTMAAYIDHTLLKPEATREDVAALCREAVAYQFYAVCVNPSFVSWAFEHLKQSRVKVCSVVGFPLGAHTSSAKAFEAREAVENGAAEIDMVLNIGALKEGDREYLLQDMRAVVRAAQGRVVKVILETGLLQQDEKVLACQLAKESGSHFVKTSTGFGPGGALPEDVRLMRRTVGASLGVKASGGIKTLKRALDMLNAGATRIGASAGVSIMEELEV